MAQLLHKLAHWQTIFLHLLEAATGPGVLQGGSRRSVQEVQNALWTDMCPWVRIILFQIIRSSQHDGAQTQTNCLQSVELALILIPIKFFFQSLSKALEDYVDENKEELLCSTPDAHSLDTLWNNLSIS